MLLTLDIENKQDLILIQKIVNRMGVKIINITQSEQSMDYHKEIIAKGVKKSSFGNPLEWQKETRTDRILPYN